MQQVKLFKSVEADIAELEKHVNAFLQEVQSQGGRVLDVAGNIAPQTVGTGKSLGGGAFSSSDLLVIVRYEKA